ncbi:hypothetical protein [Geothrix sp. PMB-07]|uniref:hypothetical protein n=1 Tax=Geothrix sp. PMB-07 TaxID=3068640 RepID=UPI002741D98F|nr:hypothetical protein [Geothrix sp. PMB-07]WLT30656.1 hypothetical protein Q9293_13120 [Geothrix sp. PMB-07]
MAVCPKPEHRGGKRPAAGDWAKYLADDRESRERIVLMDGFGRDITATEMIANIGGEDATYWDGLACPSEEECEALVARYGGDHEKAAREHGRFLSERIGALNKSERPMVAIHWDSEVPPKWHYHISGKELPKTFLYGESGTIQRAWDIEWEATEKKKIRNWSEHREYQRLKKEGDQVRAELRKLGKDRFHALKGKTGEEREAIRASFDARERSLIEKRHKLEIAAIDARYSSREMVGTAHHASELKKAENRRSGSHDRIGRRENYLRSKDEKFRQGRSITSANRQARSAARTAGAEASAIEKGAEKDHRKTRAGREAEAHQRQVERAAAELATSTFGAVKNVTMDFLGRGKDGQLLSGIASKPIEASLGRSLLRAVEAASPRGAEEVVQAITKTARTIFQSMAEGNVLKAAAAATPEMPRENPKTKDIEIDR